MAEQKVSPAGLDHEAIAEGIGELVPGKTESRVRLDGRTLAYIKKTRLAVRAAHVKRMPKKLGSAEPEPNGTWANVVVADTAAARAVLEYVVAQAAPKIDGSDEHDAAQKAGQS